MYEGQSEERKSTIQRKEEDLYARGHKDLPIIGELEKRRYDVRDDWSEDDARRDEERVNTYMKKKRSMVKNVLIASLVFFIAAMLIGLYVLSGDKNVSSAANIDMSVVGPVSVDAGKEVEMQILIENKNSAELQSAILYIDLPEGSTATMGAQEDTTRLTKELGTIGSGVLINETFKATFFGEENKEKKIYATLEYQFEGSNATLVKEIDHTVLIVSSQVGFTLSMLKEASTGQEIEIVISVDSSTSETLEGLELVMNYPFGFTYTGADPAPLFGNTTWALDPLEPFGSQEIHIRGTIEGEADNNKVFGADLGQQDKSDPRRLATVYSRAEESVIIKEAFIGLHVLINNAEAEVPVVITGNDKVYVEIPWTNNLDTKIVDMSIEARVDHAIVDRGTIVMTDNKGFFSSIDDVARWDQRTNPELAVVMPGASGKVGFTFGLGPIVQEGQLFKNVEISVRATAKGRRLSDVNVPESTKTPAVGKMRLLTSLDLLSSVLYKNGPFKNTGSIPPRVNQETTYTVLWQITNGTDKVSNTVVKTKLPPYATWKGAISPSGESVMYNDIGGEVIWNAGEVPAGTGVMSAPREVAFQIGFIPSVTQTGSVPDLIGETTLTAIDDFTGSVVSDTERARTTDLLDDSNFPVGGEKVVR